MPSNPTARRLVNLAVATGALLAHGVATADEPPPKIHPANATETPPELPRVLRLEYLRPPGDICPSEGEMENEIIYGALRNPFQHDALPVLRVTIERRAGRFWASFAFRDAAGRVLWAQEVEPRVSCLRLVERTGAIAGDMLRDPVPAPARAPALPPAAPPPPAAPASPARVEAPRAGPDRVRLDVGIGGGLVLRTAQSPVTFNLVADVGLRWRALSGALEFRWSPPEAGAVDMMGHELVRVAQYAAAVVPCGHTRTSVSFLYCGVAGAAVMHATAAPGIEPDSVTLAALMVGARLGVDLPLPVWGRRLAVRLFGDALAVPRYVTVAYGSGAMVDPGTPRTWSIPHFAATFGAAFVMDFDPKQTRSSADK